MQNPGVQKELKLGDDQVQNIKKVAKEIAAKHAEDLRKLGNTVRGDKLQRLVKNINEEVYMTLADMFKPDQKKRLQQLALQVQGEEAFQQPDIQKMLKLSEEQKDKIKVITKNALKRKEELWQNAGSNVREAAKRTWLLRGITLMMVTSLLNEDQYKVWHEMTGEPYEFHVLGEW